MNCTAVLAAGVLTLAAAGTAAPQEAARAVAPPRQRWTLTGAFNGYDLGDPNGLGIGPGAGIGRSGAGGIGFRFDLMAILDSDGFYGFSGLAADLALTGDLVRTERFQFTLSGGPSAVVGGDSDGTGGGWAGAHAALRGTAWVAPGLGMFGTGTARYLSADRKFVPGFAIGLATRF